MKKQMNPTQVKQALELTSVLCADISRAVYESALTVARMHEHDLNNDDVRRALVEMAAKLAGEAINKMVRECWTIAQKELEPDAIVAEVLASSRAEGQRIANALYAAVERWHTG